MQRKKNLLSYCIGLALVQPGAMLAVSQASAQETPPAESQQIEQVVVTGTSVERSTFDTPQSATQLDSEALESLKSSSIADVLMSLPGVSAEGGGGEVASNLFVRGLPSGGQFQFTPLLFDGIPTISTFGVHDSAFDIFQRTDLGIERLEYVTGGVSNLFGPGSVAGIVNQVSKTGGPEKEGAVQVELAEDNRLRTDFFFSGPVSDNTFYALSGFYRVDEGPLDSGLDTEGYQLRYNLKHEFDRGHFKVSGHVIDDKAQFFLPIPLDADSRERVDGNDGREVETLNSSDFAQINFLTPQGSFETGMEDAVVVKGGSIAGSFAVDITDQWGFNGNVKYATFDHGFGLPLDGLFAGGGVNAPIAQDAFLESDFVAGLVGDAAGGSDIASGRFTFSRTGQELAPDDLLFGNVLADRKDRDTTDFSAEFNLTYFTNIAGLDHNFTFGTFWANTRGNDVTNTHSVLGDFTNGSNAVDLTVTTEDGTDIIVSQNGLLDPAFGGFGGDFTREAKRFAFYAADQIEANRWAFDIGIRVEHMDGLVIERTRSEITDFPTQFVNDPRFNSDIANGDLAVSDALNSVVVRDGGFNRDTVSETEYAVALGGLYRLTDNINLFGNLSRGFFFPQLDALGFDDPNDPLAVTPGELNRDYQAEIIQLGELGIKYDQGRLKGQASAFWTQLEDRLFAENTAQGREVFETSTESYGLEFSGEYMIVDNLYFRGNATVFEAEFTTFEFGGGSLEGNEPNRQPNTVNTGLFYNDGTWDFALMHNFQGEAFADNGNNVKLDSYNTFRLDAGYTLHLAGGESARFSINIWNLTDDEGLTEGSPRAGVDQAGDTQGFFTGRPVLPRRITARFTYNF